MLISIVCFILWVVVPHFIHNRSTSYPMPSWAKERPDQYIGHLVPTDPIHVTWLVISDKSLFASSNSSRKSTYFAGQLPPPPPTHERVHDEKYDLSRQDIMAVTTSLLFRYFATLLLCARTSDCCSLTFSVFMRNARSSLVAIRSGFRNPLDVWMRDTSDTSHPFFCRPEATTRNTASYRLTCPPCIRKHPWIMCTAVSVILQSTQRLLSL